MHTQSSRFAAGMFLTFLATACEVPAVVEPPPPEPGFEVAVGSVHMVQGDSVKLTVTAVRRNGFSEAIDVEATGLPAGVRSAIGRVEPGGFFTELTLRADWEAAVGEATITVTGTGSSGRTHSARAGLTVAPKTPVASIIVRLPRNVTNSEDIPAGLIVPADLFVRDAVGNPLVGRRIVWSSTNPDVATVDSAGIVTLHRPGRVAIRATGEGRTGEAWARVIPDLRGTRWQAPWGMPMALVAQGNRWTHVFNPTSTITFDFAARDPADWRHGLTVVMKVRAVMTTRFGPDTQEVIHTGNASISGSFLGLWSCQVCINMTGGWYIHVPVFGWDEAAGGIKGTLVAEYLIGDPPNAVREVVSPPVVTWT
jgi:hypothetical protein